MERISANLLGPGVVRARPPNPTHLTTKPPASLSRTGASKPPISTEPKNPPSGINAANKQTPRTKPQSLQEQLALEEAKSGSGRLCRKLKNRDPNYPSEEWQKMQHQHTNPDGSKINIHYWENKGTGKRHGFKFKDIDN